MFFKKQFFILLLVVLVFLSSEAAKADEVPVNPGEPAYIYYSLAQKVYTLHIDENVHMVNLFINRQGRTMISASELTGIFPCSVEWADGSNVLVVKGEHYCGFTLNEATYFTHDQVKEMDTTPTRIDDDIYLPLYYIAQEFGYSLAFCSEHEQYFAYSNFDVITELACEEYSPAADITVPDNLPLWGSLSTVETFTPLYESQNLIAGFYTTLLDRSDARTNNINLAAQAIDNIILAPGEIFSFNQIVGERTYDKGYREAPIFIGDEITPGIGGGICQVSSTLYNTALSAGLPILERHPHTLKVAYVPLNQDATVTWGISDFRFKNNLEHPVKLMTKVINNYVITGIFNE